MVRPVPRRHRSQARTLDDEPRLSQIWQGDILLLKRRWRVTDDERPFNFTWLLGQIVREKRIFRDIATGRGHIANNTDIYVRAHGAVMLGLPNSDPYI